ncbi:hypothetical protein H4S06_004326 [Coemansia sp. BCRC 34490]|nr:hypothetical protein H4S06_004326 [Coemansia sp. BCRC 34490]
MLRRTVDCALRLRAAETAAVCLQTQMPRTLRTSAQHGLPRISMHEYQQLRRKQQEFEAGAHGRFGTYQRIVPSTLVKRKAEAREPSLELVPSGIERPAYASTGTAEPVQSHSQIPVLTGEEIERMRVACVIARDALALGGSMVRPGVTTAAIDREVHGFIVSRGAYPSCLNYLGFPRSICTSVNNIIAHGIPDDACVLADGDCINIDVTVYKHGFHGDTSAMFVAGSIDAPGCRLLDTTQEALELAIQACGPQVPFSTIGTTIESLVAPLGFSVSQELTGHGVGRDFHQRPLIYHHANDLPGAMEPGMAFTIEPIVSQGVAAGVLWPDGWTVATADGARSAQYEHTVVVTADGIDVLTA